MTNVRKPEGTDDLDRLIEDLGLDCESLLVVGGPTSIRNTERCIRVAYADVPAYTRDSKIDLGVVVEPTKTDIAVISRLRDVLCRRVLLVLKDENWPRNELLALGFVERQPGDGLRLFLHDLDLVNQPREWNNPSNWANPENFDKYRW